MPVTAVLSADLQMVINPEVMGFADMSALPDQARAQMPACFSLEMQPSDNNLFVLGEVGSRRSTLLRQSLQTVAAA